MFDIKILDVISEACREIHDHPEDLIQDIFNEYLKKWNIDLRMNHNFNLCDHVWMEEQEQCEI